MVLPRYPGPVWGNVTPASACVRACHKTMPDFAPNRNGNPPFLASFLSGCVREWHAMSEPCQGITQDVPAEALALGRSRQVVKQGWAARLRGLKSLGKKGSSQ